MSTAQLIQEAHNLGINLWIEGERLKYKAPKGVVSGEIKEKLKSHKPEIISLITQRIARTDLHGQSLDELKLLAADDWTEYESDPSTLEAFAKSVATRKLREEGIKPDNYTQASHCQQCGPIWLWKGAPSKIQACVWCFNRVSGIDMPRPTLISCINCKHYINNDYSPSAGIGECRKSLSARFANQQHNCNQFQSKENQS